MRYLYTYKLLLCKLYVRSEACPVHMHSRAVFLGKEVERNRMDVGKKTKIGEKTGRED